MEIRGLGNPLAAVFGQRTPAEQLSQAASAAKAQNAESSAMSSSPLGQILADYDLHQITPRQFNELLDRLKIADILTPREHQQLSQLRLELDTHGAEPDKPVDLLDFIAKKLADLRNRLNQAKEIEDDGQQAALQATLAITQEQSKWLDKLDAARRERPINGIDAKA